MLRGNIRHSSQPGHRPGNVVSNCPWPGKGDGEAPTAAGAHREVMPLNLTKLEADQCYDVARYHCRGLVFPIAAHSELKSTQEILDPLALTPSGW
jgi:hypothetical protein